MKVSLGQGEMPRVSFMGRPRSIARRHLPG
jgi:hypothetical protein